MLRLQLIVYSLLLAIEKPSPFFRGAASDSSPSICYSPGVSQALGSRPDPEFQHKIQSLLVISWPARWGGSGIGCAPSPRTGGWCSSPQCGCSPWPASGTSSAPSRRWSRKPLVTTSGSWRRSASPRTSATASASSPGRSRPCCRRGRCCLSARRRTSSATAGSGSSSPGRRRRCPSG